MVAPFTGPIRADVPFQRLGGGPVHRAEQGRWAIPAAWWWPRSPGRSGQVDHSSGLVVAPFTGPIRAGGPFQRLGGGPVHRSNNSLSQSPRPPRSPDSKKPAETTTDSVQPSAVSSRENVNRPNEDGEVPRTKERLEVPPTVAEELLLSRRQGSSPEGQPLVDGVRQEVSVDVEPTPVDVRVSPSTVSDSIILVVPDHHALYSTRRGLSNKEKKRSVQLHPFKSYGGSPHYQRQWMSVCSRQRLAIASSWLSQIS